VKAHAVLLVVAVLASAGCTGDHAAPSSRSAGIVASVVDGDTIHLRDGRKVRIVQVDAPESYPPERAQCWGSQAADALRARLPVGSKVDLSRDPALDDHDQYGRLLRDVSFEGTDLGVWLVAHGHALPYFFHGDRGRHADELLTAAKVAQDAKLGMWRRCRGVHLDPARGA
jgi:endonuclease YncB( thermonuclease family)